MRHFRSLGAALAGAVLFLLSAPLAHALESTPVSSPRAVATLVSDTDRAAPGQPFRIGLRLRLSPGWHTYWKNPGDAGVAPDIAVTLPAGAHAGPVEWPAPERLTEGQIVTYGYTGEVLLPLTVTPAASGATVVEAHASWLVCETICVPEEADFRLDLAAGSPAPSAQAPLFAAADAAMPRPSPWQARVSPDGVLSLSGTGLDPGAVTGAMFIPDGPAMIDPAAPQSLGRSGDAMTLKMKASKPVAALSGVLLLRDRSGTRTALTIAATSAPASAGATGDGVTGDAPPRARLPFIRVIAFAFLGGLILNLMPCVFPVLAMKAVSIASGTGRGEVRLHALLYTAGVLVAFTVLGAALLAARTAGSAAGWGFQFQSPVLVSALVWLLFAIGLNLSGVFEIGFGVGGAGQSLASRQGHIGSFFTGLLAVVVATPCTAPFMGVAIGAALAAPAASGVLVFVAMGLGLALPYLLLAALPSVARAVPRPGRWMLILKQALAFPMYAAAAWLIWVVSLQAGPAGVLTTAAGLVLIGFAAWAAGLGQGYAGQRRRVAHSMALAALLAAAAVLSGMPRAVPVTAEAPARSADHEEAFTAARLTALRAEGRPVFVNMTAAWCVTCLVNERLALSPAPVREAFAREGVAYLKGDWTRQDPEVTRFLRAHGRDGVPLYALFRPGADEPTILPQILTEQIVLNELRKTGG